MDRQIEKAERYWRSAGELLIQWANRMSTKNLSAGVWCLLLVFVYEVDESQAATISFNTSISQGFNFSRTSQLAIGYINSLRISGIELAADLHVTDPMDSGGSPLMTVGVMSLISWDGGVFRCNSIISSSVAGKQSGASHPPTPGHYVKYG